MAHARHATTRSPRYALGTADTTPTRLVVLLLLAVAIAALLLVATVLSQGNASETARQLASFNPRSLFSEDSRHFLPPPVAVIPPEKGAGPPVPAAGEAGASGQVATRVKVANTGGVGALLRAEPPQGRPIAALRDGAVLQVLERQNVGDGEWLHVRTANGVEGWIYGRLVGPAQ